MVWYMRQSSANSLTGEFTPSERSFMNARNRVPMTVPGELQSLHLRPLILAPSVKTLFLPERELLIQFKMEPRIP